MTNAIEKNQELKSRTTQFLSQLDSRVIREAMENENDDIVADLFSQAGVSSRESYLVWVRDYKELINEISDMQRTLRATSKKKDSEGLGGDLERMYRDYNRPRITELLRMREASKVAARISRSKAVASAA